MFIWLCVCCVWICIHITKPYLIYFVLTHLVCYAWIHSFLLYIYLNKINFHGSFYSNNIGPFWMVCESTFIVLLIWKIAIIFLPNIYIYDTVDFKLKVVSVKFSHQNLADIHRNAHCKYLVYAVRHNEHPFDSHISQLFNEQN